ncbi:hypothetical protein HZB01_05170 [Candidatus Woesearchaeota archaeon]|nr:hypothetical protein [Candidatus Woesearchaeota archaeon]
MGKGGTMANRLSFGVVLCAALLISGFTYGEESKSLREALIAESTVTRVYTIDDYHSLVVGELRTGGGDVTAEFDKKMQELCIKYGGVPELKLDKEVDVDPITKKGYSGWLPPDKVKSYDRFAVGWLLNRYTPRCNGVFEVTEKFGHSYKGHVYYESFLFKHNTSQPFLYKNPTLPAYDTIAIPPDGEFKLPLIGEGFTGFLKGLAGHNIYYGASMYQYASVLCRKNGGDMLFVIPGASFSGFASKEEALKQALQLGLNKDSVNLYESIDGSWNFSTPGLVEAKDALTAFINRFSKTNSSSMIFACKGEKKFVIREDFKGDYKAFFASNRGLEGVDYITKEAANKIGLQDKTSVLAAPASVEPTKQVGFEEQMAQDVSAQKTPTIKIHAGSKYTGRYNGVSGDGCDLVSVTKVWDPALKEKGRVDVNNYKVCQGKVASMGETGVESTPENVKRYIPEVAKACQKKGTAKFDFGEYVIACTALRDQSMCNVEVNILKEGKLIQSKVVNGCL